MLRVLPGLIALFVTEAAYAACPAPYTTDALLGDMVGVESALRASKTADAASGAKKLEEGLPCLDETLPTMIAGRAYRAIAGGYIAGGDDAKGARWLLTAVEIESNFEYGLEDLPAEHPVRNAWTNAKMAPPSDPAPVEGRVWTAGKVWLDGRIQTGAPAARVERPHLVQLNDGTGVKSWLIEGSALPAEVLAGPAVAVAPVKTKAPKGPKVVPIEPTVAEADPPKEPEPAKPTKEPKAPKVVPTEEPTVAEADPPKEPKPEKEAKVKPQKAPTVNESGAVVMERQRPWEKTPLMIGGAALLGASGVLYWQSSVHHDAFWNDPAVDTQDEVLAEQSAANTLFLATGAVLAVGVGTLTWGVVLDGGTALPTVGWRF